jgi:hypothetical protein
VLSLTGEGVDGEWGHGVSLFSGLGCVIQETVEDQKTPRHWDTAQRVRDDYCLLGVPRLRRR